MKTNHKRSYFDEDPAKQASSSESQSDGDEGFETGDEPAQELPDDAPTDQADDAPPEPPNDAPPEPPNDAPPDPADDDGPELVSVICKMCQLIQRRQAAWEMTYCPTEPIEPDYYYLDLLVPVCKALNIDLCIINGRAVIGSEL